MLAQYKGAKFLMGQILILQRLLTTGAIAGDLAKIPDSLYERYGEK